MHRFRFVLSMVLFVAGGGSVRAGVYCSLDQLPYPVPVGEQAFEKIDGARLKLRPVLNEEKPDNPTRKVYLERVTLLEQKKAREGLTLEERIDLSGLYLRLHKFGDVINLLPNADETQPFVMTHLAAANLGLADLDSTQAFRYLQKAVYYQEKALAAWPEVSLRWSVPQLNWYRRSERYFLELLRLRLQEARQGTTTYKNVDALFPRLRFESPDGAYFVGGPPAREVERLQDDAPADALQIVAQLVWWLPVDNRLYWLFGELLNHQGDLADAYKVFAELGGGGSFDRPVLIGAATFKQHNRDLTAAWNRLKLRAALGYLVAPRSLGMGLNAAPWHEAGLLIAMNLGLELDDESKGNELRAKLLEPITVKVDPQPAPPAPSPPSTGPERAWLPDWRTVAVSFAAGMLFMGLILLQWREWSRRRAAAPARRELTG